MQKDNLRALFEPLEHEFDHEIPAPGHEKRFLEKLNNSAAQEKLKKQKSYKTYLAVAASVLIVAGILSIWKPASQPGGLETVSTELSQTENFFTAAISSELNKIKDQTSPENQMVVKDGLKHLTVLEENYIKLQRDLKNSGNDKRVIAAMIQNFQSRIQVLENVLKSIEHLKETQQTQEQPMNF